MEEAWVLCSLEWRLVVGSVVSSWQIRDTVFKFFAKWVMILEKKQIKEEQNTSHDGIFIRKGLKCISQN